MSNGFPISAWLSSGQPSARPTPLATTCFGEELVASLRRLPEAQSRYRELRDESGWQPPHAVDLDPEERLRREREAQERASQAEHWHRVKSRRGWFKGHRV